MRPAVRLAADEGSGNPSRFQRLSRFFFAALGEDGPTTPAGQQLARLFVPSRISTSMRPET
jgi:hypothetical protein